MWHWGQQIIFGCDLKAFPSIVNECQPGNYKSLSDWPGPQSIQTLDEVYSQHISNIMLHVCSSWTSPYSYLIIFFFLPSTCGSSFYFVRIRDDLVKLCGLLSQPHLLNCFGKYFLCRRVRKVSSKKKSSFWRGSFVLLRMCRWWGSSSSLLLWLMFETLGPPRLSGSRSQSPPVSSSVVIQLHGKFKQWHSTAAACK